MKIKKIIFLVFSFVFSITLLFENNTNAATTTTVLEKYASGRVKINLIKENGKNYRRNEFYDKPTNNLKISAFYDGTGTYYTFKNYWKDGIRYKKEYWKGAYPNRITHVANYNTANDEWINVMHYYYPNAENKKEYVTYTGTSSNKRKTSVGYREDGTRQWYKQYNSAGLLHHMTYYDSKGTTKTIETEIFPNEQVRNWQINYQLNGIDRKSIVYKNKDDEIIKVLEYYDKDNVIRTEKLYEEGDLQEIHNYNETGEFLITSYYYEDGVIYRKIEQSGTVENLIINEWLYDEYGKLVTEIKYDGSGKIEKEIDYDENTVKSEETSYVDEIRNISIGYNKNNDSLIKDYIIYYDENGKTIKEETYTESGEIAEIGYYNSFEIVYRVKKYENGELIFEGNIDVTQVDEEIQKDLDETNDEMNRYVDINNTIEYTENNLEELINSQTENISQEDKESAIKNMASVIDEINQDINSGEKVLLNDGELVDKALYLQRGGKTKGPKFYWWGMRLWYSTAKAKSVGKNNVKVGRLLYGGGILIKHLAKFGTHPGIITAARVVGSGAKYLGWQINGLGNRMLVVNKGHRRGIIADLNWVLYYKVYKQ